MKKGRNLLIFTMVLVVFVAAYLSINYIVNKTSEDETTKETTYVSIVETDPGEICAISYIYEGETYSFAWDGSTWLSASDNNMPIDQTSLGEMTSAISVIEADRHLSDTGAHSADYGFDNPDFTINVTYTDGGTLTYYLGAISSHSGEYYFAMKGEPDVWMINAALADYFSYTYDDLLMVDTMDSINSDTVIKITATYPDGNVRTLEKSKAAVVTTDDEGNQATEETTVYVITNEAGAAAQYDEDAGLSAIEAFTDASLTSSTCTSYYTDESTDLSVYGLDLPILVAITYEKEISVTAEDSSTSTIIKEYTYTLSLGVVNSENENGEPEISSYLMLPDSVMIFEIDITVALILIY